MHRLVSAQSQLSRDPLEKLELDDLRALEQGMRAVLRVMGVPLAAVVGRRPGQFLPAGPYPAAAANSLATLATLST